MAHKITPFLMFEGSAEEAMRFYVSLFSRSEIKRVELYGAGEPGTEGSVFSFTPSISLFVECENEAEFDAAFGQLSTGGAVLMPPDNYGFSRKFGWLNDRYGVSWQLNLQ